MKKRPVPIGDVLKSVFANLEQSKKITKEDIEGIWKRSVGETAFAHSRPITLRKNVLSIRVDNSGWLQNLVMQKRRLLKELKRDLGKDKISDIHFKIGEFWCLR